MYDPKTKQQYYQLKIPSSLHLKKAKPVCSKLMCLLIVVSFLDIRGIVRDKFISKGETEPAFLYIYTAASTGRCGAEKTTQEWRTDDWILHHNNAPPYSVLSVQEFMVKNGTTVVLHLPCSPHVAPCNSSFSRTSVGTEGKKI
jgi:hypothetical protein